ncbi:hypothetical protein BDF21DRAFT_410228 [Thamnidium elegans]|nr:hypothetical protein BDF21DRAFT_410228 [Thamnidium elegans]
MLVETCGVYGNVAMLKIQFDRHKGLYACLAMLCTIVVKFKYASLSTFNNIKIIFLHSKGNIYITLIMHYTTEYRYCIK